MILWLASYPKSGNTLLRSMLSAYFFSKDGVYDFSFLQNIKQFPNLKLFEKFGVDISDDENIIKNYIKVQEKFVSKNSVQFVKTHSQLFNFHNKYPFTNMKNSLGVIYIVRDPRNVAMSFANHSDISIDESVDTMINKFYIGSNYVSNEKKYESIVYSGNWSSNYKSWKSFIEVDKYLLIKYEELITNREKTFIKILKFIHHLDKKNFLPDKQKLNNVLKTTEFEYLKNLEKKKGFSEAKKTKETNKPITFFDSGQARDWKKDLDKKNINKLVSAFKNEMLELGYL